MTTNVNIRLASDRVDNALLADYTAPRLYTPGESIILHEGFMKYVIKYFLKNLRSLC